MSTISDIIQEREPVHGEYATTSAAAQALKSTIRQVGDFNVNLTSQQRESLEMIATKIARIISGDSNHVDHWQDIIGYATLAMPKRA